MRNRPGGVGSSRHSGTRKNRAPTHCGSSWLLATATQSRGSSFCHRADQRENSPASSAAWPSASKNARNPQPPPATVGFGDAARPAIPKLGNQQVFFLLPAFQIEREHGWRMKLQGIFADITTPFDHNGDIYKVKVQHNVEKWNRTTLAGYVVCGAAGEGALLTAEEKVAVWEMVAKYAAQDKLLIAASAAPGVRETVWLSNRAAELGYKAALIDSPHHRPETSITVFPFGGGSVEDSADPGGRRAGNGGRRATSQRDRRL